MDADLRVPLNIKSTTRILLAAARKGAMSLSFHSASDGAQNKSNWVSRPSSCNKVKWQSTYQSKQGRKSIAVVKLAGGPRNTTWALVIIKNLKYCNLLRSKRFAAAEKLIVNTVVVLSVGRDTLSVCVVADLRGFLCLATLSLRTYKPSLHMCPIFPSTWSSN